MARHLHDGLFPFGNFNNFPNFREYSGGETIVKPAPEIKVISRNLIFPLQRQKSTLENGTDNLSFSAR